MVIIPNKRSLQHNRKNPDLVMLVDNRQKETNIKILCIQKTFLSFALNIFLSIHSY